VSLNCHFTVFPSPFNKVLADKNKTFKYAKSRSEFTSVLGVECGWYLEVFLVEEFTSAMGGFPLQPGEEGYLTLQVPRWGNEGPERVGVTAVADDYGHIVHGAFLNAEKYNRKLVQGISDIKSFTDITSTFEKVTGKKSRVKYLDSAEDFQTYGVKVLEDVREMFRFLQRAKGRYFDGEETEMETARGLKADAFMAMGVPEDYTLTSLEEFFQKYFGKGSEKPTDGK
jgi:hypothetical protein